MRSTGFILALFSVILALHSSLLLAQQEAVPTEVFYDKEWLKTASGEWLRGEIIAFYDDKLEFDSEEFETQFIDAEDVSEIRTADVFRVRLNGGRMYTGHIELKDQVLFIHQGFKSEEVLFSNVLTMVPYSDNRISMWSGSVNVGVNFRKGNITQNDVNVRIQLQRRTALNRLKLDYVTNRSEQGNTNSEVKSTVDNERVNLIYDWFFSNKLFIRAMEYEHYSDPFSNIEQRDTYGVGLGYSIIDRNKLEWSATIGPSYQKTEFSVSDDGSLVEKSGALSLGTLIDWEVSERIDFVLDYQLQFLRDNVGGRLQTLKTGFDVEITNDFEVDVMLFVDRNDNPPPIADGTNPEKNDYQLNVSIGYEF